MGKMDGMSMDLKAENIAQLKALFPEAVTEGKVDFEVLKALLDGEIEQRQEYYKFTWNGKEAARAYARTRSMGTLRPCVEESSGKDGTPGKFDSDNLYIEGDNLEVLKLLQGAYHKRIKMIYIDPPYNTGKDFVYPDNFKDSIGNYKALTGQTDDEGKSTRANPETSGRYHTDWLNMMYPRLILARNLLTDDGVIFISIDDSEQNNLKKLCDEVFGEENFYTQIIIQSNKRGQTYKQISKTHEYLLVYTRDIDTDFNELEKDGDSNDLNLLDDIGNFNIRELRNRNPKFGRHNRPNLYYPIYVNPDIIDCNGFSPVSTEKTDDFYVEIYPLNSEGDASCWRWGRDKTKQNCSLQTMNCDLVAKRKSNGSYNIYEKYRKTTYKPKTIWDDVSVITEKGTVELGELGLSAFFDFPKPIGLLHKVLQIGTNQEDIILDFFSGSATTAHAVQQLNAEDGGNRKYIMVQLPEVCEAGTEAAKAGYANICEIGKERIRRAVKKIKGEHSDWNGDMGFKVFKLDTSNLLPWNPNADELEQNLFAAVDNVLEGRTTDDLLHEILLKCNLPLTLPIETKQCGSSTIYLVGAGALAICLDKNIPATIAEEIVHLRDEYAPIVPMQVVFRDNGFNDVTKTNALQILKQAGFEEKSIQTI